MFSVPLAMDAITEGLAVPQRFNGPGSSIHPHLPAPASGYVVRRLGSLCFPVSVPDSVGLRGLIRLIAGGLRRAQRHVLQSRFHWQGSVDSDSAGGLRR